MRWLAILNIRSGAHSPREFLQLSQALKRIGAEVVQTSRREETAELVRQYKNYDGIIAVGGDGTIAEIVNEIDINKQRLGIIPGGTGNGLAHDLGLKDEGAAIHALSHPHFENLDVIDVRFQTTRGWSDKTVISTSGIGYLAGATEIGEYPFKRLGSWWYAIAAIGQSLRQKEFFARLRIDEEPWQELPLTTIIVHNNQYVGQFRIFPEASLTDGRLNLLYGRLRPRQQLFEDLGILTQTYLFARSLRRAPRSVDIVVPVPTMLMLDGDLIPDVKRVHYQVAPGKLCCCTGPAGTGVRKLVNTTNPPRMSA